MPTFPLQPTGHEDRELKIVDPEGYPPVSTLQAAWTVWAGRDTLSVRSYPARWVVRGVKAPGQDDMFSGSAYAYAEDADPVECVCLTRDGRRVRNAANKEEVMRGLESILKAPLYIEALRAGKRNGAAYPRKVAIADRIASAVAAAKAAPEFTDGLLGPIWDGIREARKYVGTF